ncbi:gamma-glutamyl-gamma-aminobutyrate hydrolase family protein [Agromyces archimandritae]|uniref:gamma-glutamyl-gamma-aminobutyrate hydrolase family protein n=1 Tax=Agromyces archimandritae TaxID=2781962 RepID=UPI0031402F5D
MASNDSELRPAGPAGDAPGPAGDGIRRPLIGITSYLEQAQTGVWDVPASFLPKVYLDGVTDAGGIAIVLPPQPVDAAIAARVIGSLDGLIVAGGADIDPARYGQEPHERTGAPRPDRDAWEDALLAAAIETGLPFLGICRGAQLMNVALGGTLVQHLPDVVGSETYQPGAGVFGRAGVDVDPASRLGGLVDARLDVPVYHHQAVGRVADGLRVTARTADGVIQGVELPGHPFAVGVQWHPEEDTADRRLFAGLVDAARARMPERSPA